MKNNNVKEIYVAPAIEVVSFDTTKVLTGSDTPDILYNWFND